MPTTVRYGGAWRNAIPLVRYGGTWRNALVYVRHGGVWKLVGGAPTASTSTSLVAGTCFRTTAGVCTAVTGVVSVSVSGGSGNYSYAWEFVSGTSALVNSPTSSSTTFSRTGTVSLEGTVIEGVYRCKVTDNLTGQVAYTNNVTVRTNHIRSV